MAQVDEVSAMKRIWKPQIVGASAFAVGRERETLTGWWDIKE